MFLHTKCSEITVVTSLQISLKVIVKVRVTAVSRPEECSQRFVMFAGLLTLAISVEACESSHLQFFPRHFQDCFP